MKPGIISVIIRAGILISITAFLLPLTLDAQKKGTHPAARPAKTSSSRQEGSAGKANTGGNKAPATGEKVSTTPSSEGKKQVSKESGAKMDNSGTQKVSSGTSTNPPTGTKKVSSGTSTNPPTGTKNVSTGNKTNVSGNTVNVNNSKNVTVNNSRSTVVVANPRPYPRPPYAYGGHSYYAYHPYHYHPYHPYHYGPAYHPWGFFVATMAVTAMIITIESQQYHYDQGVYYVSANDGYTVVPAPVGATITTLPPGSQTVVISETTNNYYYGGTYYEKSDKGYTVVQPTAGTVVETLPEGGTEVKLGDVTYVKVGETYYQPIEQDGKSMYEVVEVKDGQ